MSADLPPLREVIAAYDLGARKTLGQHFLLDQNVTDKIVRLSGVVEGDVALEIGPGPGGLTRSLLRAGARVVAVERDARCLRILAELGEAFPNRLDVVAGDALTIDEFACLGSRAPVRIVANLPYNISTELLIKWLKAGGALWRSMTLMFQKEVADRICAEHGSKTYGRLSVIAQATSAPSRLFELPARAFTPPPKVRSTVVSFEPKACDVAPALERVTAAAFGQRRKMARTSLRGAFGEETPRVLASTGIEATARAEEISVEGYIALARALAASPSRAR